MPFVFFSFACFFISFKSFYSFCCCFFVSEAVFWGWRCPQQPTLNCPNRGLGVFPSDLLMIQVKKRMLGTSTFLLRVCSYDRLNLVSWQEFDSNSLLGLLSFQGFLSNCSSMNMDFKFICVMARCKSTNIHAHVNIVNVIVAIEADVGVTNSFSALWKFFE